MCRVFSKAYLSQSCWQHTIDKLTKVDLLVLENLGMKRLPQNAAEDLLEIVVRRYEKGSIIMTTNRPLEDWGQVLGDTAAAGVMAIESLQKG